MGFNFQLGGIEALKKRLEKAGIETHKKIDNVIEKNVAAINEEQVRRTPIDRSELRKDTFFKETGGGKKIEYTLFSNAPYAAFIEFGTRKKFKPIAGIDAGAYQPKKGGKGDFYNSILQWVKRKGIAGRYSVKTQKKLNTKADREREEAAAYAIYRSILINGINPHPFFFSPFLEKKDKIVKEIAEVLSEI